LAVSFLTCKKIRTLQSGKHTQHQTFSGKVTVLGSLKQNAYIEQYCLCVCVCVCVRGGISIKTYYVECNI
jgi:hypothetical protein